MFSGIIEATGSIDGLEQTGGDLRVVISSAEMVLADIAIGDSVCVSGVCLTVTVIDGNRFTADVSNETVALTTFSRLQEGDAVNLEKALRPSDRFGGHIVSGHVDGLAVLLSRENDGRSERLLFSAPHELGKYIAVKGSVCLDGVSLTVNEVDGNRFGVNIIPHTAARTTFHGLQPGQKVNLEVDMISRYLERLLQDRTTAGGGEGITLEKLKRCGFLDR